MLPLLRLLVLLWRRRLTVSALHPFSLAARLTRLSSTGRRRELLTGSWLYDSPRLALLSCAHRCPGCRRPELYRFILTLRRILWGLTLPWTLLITGPSRWLTTLFLLLRGRILES